MRDHVLVYINGTRHEVRGADVFRTVSGFLRETLRLVGTKIVCEEGDCGACTVLIGRVRDGEVRYVPLNSCILQMHQLDLTHVITVEGLRQNGELSEVQRRMVELHGAQCGFCTPGFITAMTAMFEEKDRLSEHEVRRGLTGNLCRCTGYEPIIKAALAAEPEGLRRLNVLYPAGDFITTHRRHAHEAVMVETGDQVFFSATDIEGAVRFKAEHPDAVIVQGGTDYGVWCNKRAFVPRAVLNVSRIEELGEIELRDGVLEVGGTVTLQQLQDFVPDLVPDLWDVLDIFGAPQIRHAGTLAGNIGNGSPIADTLPFLYVVEAELELSGGRSTVDGGQWTGENGETGEPEVAPHTSHVTRRVGIRDFYKGYKQFDLAPSEIITRILIPLPKDGEVLRLYKVSKRLDLDISTFTAAFLMRLQGDVIEEMRIAYGGVGPVVFRLPETEAFLVGRPFSEDAFIDAGPLAREDITPISDVRGSADYRYQLAESILLKFYHQAGEAVAA